MRSEEGVGVRRNDVDHAPGDQRRVGERRPRWQRDGPRRAAVAQAAGRQVAAVVGPAHDQRAGDRWEPLRRKYLSCSGGYGTWLHASRDIAEPSKSSGSSRRRLGELSVELQRVPHVVTSRTTVRHPNQNAPIPCRPASTQIGSCGVTLRPSAKVADLPVVLTSPGAQDRDQPTNGGSWWLTTRSIRAFRVNVPDEDLAELHRRIAATRWPSKELVADRSQGVQLATTQQLARYWESEYDWRRCEARRNMLPQFTTEIDGLNIHFIHVKSRSRERVAVDHDARLARLGDRAARDHRPPHRPDRARRTGGGRVPPRVAVHSRLRLLR